MEQELVMMRKELVHHRKRCEQLRVVVDQLYPDLTSLERWESDELTQWQAEFDICTNLEHNISEFEELCSLYPTTRRSLAETQILYRDCETDDSDVDIQLLHTTKN